MAAGDIHLTNLHRRGERQQRNGKKPKATRITETECHASDQKNQQVFEVMPGAGDGPARGRPKREYDNGQGEEPGRNLG